MNMIADMINAETMIAFAAGAVSELHIGAGYICFPADRAFVPVGLVEVFALRLFRSPFIADRPRRGSRPERAKVFQQVTAADN